MASDDDEPPLRQQLAEAARTDAVADMTDVAIRPYSDEDFAEVTSIWLGSWQTTGVPLQVTLDDLRARWSAELADGWIVHVAVSEGQILGFIAYRGNIVEQLFIAPDSQGYGIGKRLLDFAKAQMPSGFRLHTATQSRAGRFYEREGLLRGETRPHPRHGHSITDYAWSPRETRD